MTCVVLRNTVTVIVFPREIVISLSLPNMKVENVTGSVTVLWKSSFNVSIHVLMAMCVILEEFIVSGRLAAKLWEDPSLPHEEFKILLRMLEPVRGINLQSVLTCIAR